MAVLKVMAEMLELHAVWESQKWKGNGSMNNSYIATIDWLSTRFWKNMEEKQVLEIQPNASCSIKWTLFCVKPLAYHIVLAQNSKLLPQARGQK